MPFAREWSDLDPTRERATATAGVCEAGYAVLRADMRRQELDVDIDRRWEDVLKSSRQQDVDRRSRGCGCARWRHEPLLDPLAGSVGDLLV